MEAPRILVTTSQKASDELTERARRYAEELGGRFVPRGGRGLGKICREHGVEGLLVVGDNRVSYQCPAQGLEYFFHVGTVKLRLHNLETGRADPMASAMRLESGDTVLDCTLGRANDAIVASYLVGGTGRVVGLEVQPVIAFLARCGLQTLSVAPTALQEAMRRIETHCADYEEVLPTRDAGSFDVVYFDPIFETPVPGSVHLIPLRHLADKRPVSAEAVRQARRVARRCVVVKQSYKTKLWAELPPDEVVRGKSSGAEYGVFSAGARWSS